MSISKEQMTAMLSGRDRFKCGLTDLVPIVNTTPTTAQDGADTRKGVGVLLVHNGKLLCATRRKEGTICGPGGHIEEMELPEDAAVRETQEEFGITPLDLIPLAELTSMPEEYCDSQIYLSTDYDGTIKCDEEEMTRPGFIAIDTVQQLAEQSPERLFLPFALSVEKFVQLILTPDAQKATMKERTDFNEAEHPRDKNGQFTDGNASKTGGSSSQVSATGANKFEVGFTAKNLDKHWGGKSDHSPQYPNMTKEQYAERALSLIQSPTSKTILGYKTPRGEVVRYDTQSGDFVKGFPKTGIKTMFKPDDAEDYFLRHKRIDKGVDTE